LLKSLAGELNLLAGERTSGEHLKLGYFTQHQLEALDLDASPALHLQRLSPKAREQEIRSFLGGFNFRGDAALTPIRNSSGGEKARLALAIVVWQKPNLLLLDEPTNHLDLEMCHALTVALQEFEGAVVVVSHDRHLLRNTVEELLLVADGRVQEFDGDLQDYSNWLLSEARAQRDSGGDNRKEKEAAPKLDKKAQRQQSADQRKQLSTLKQQLQKVERELSAMQQKVADLNRRLADSSLYEDSQREHLQPLLKEQGLLQQQSHAREEQWLQLQEELEKLQAEAK
jgi:ATP-binding cassette subfamily F protein 3